MKRPSPARDICEWFKKKNIDISFEEIIKQNVKPGMSRFYITNLLNKLTNNELHLTPTAIWNAIKKNPNINFKFEGRKNNQYKTITLMNQATFTCIECGFSTKKIIKLKDIIGLKAYQCPQCKQFETTEMVMLKKNKIIYKKMENGREITKEKIKSK